MARFVILEMLNMVAKSFSPVKLKNALYLIFTGIEYQPITCKRNDGIQVTVDHCNINNDTVSRACHIDCPVHCVLTEYGPWSKCNAPCGPSAVKTRSRRVRVKANRYGRQCPPSSTHYQVLANVSLLPSF